MELVACTICGQDQTVALYSKAGYNIVKCRLCGLAYVNPRRFRVEEDDYFRGIYLATIEENGKLKSDIEMIYSQIVSNLNTYLKPGRLLDVGSAMGHFMAFARAYGWSVHGVECSPLAADYARHRWDLDVQTHCDLREVRLPDDSFDACVLIEVVEHLPDPRATLTEILHLLKPGGMLYVTTPNFSSFRSLLQLENWKAVIPVGHLYYFDAATLSKLLLSVGFTGLIELTSPADFEEELESIRANGTLRIEPVCVEEIRCATAIEDAGKLSNGRSEGLVLSATKPRSSRDVTVAALGYRGPMPPIEGKLVRVAGDTVEDQKVYLVDRGRKHWITSADWLRRHGMRIEDATIVERDLLDSLLCGYPLE